MQNELKAAASLKLIAVVAALALPSVAVARPTSAAERKAVEAAVKKELKDPESAKFSHPSIDIPQGKVGAVYCGKVNAKNSFGGYTGDVLFAAGFGTGKEDGKTVVVGELIGLGNADPSSLDSRALRVLCEKTPKFYDSI